MNQLLQQAFDRASRLPPQEQDRFAQFLLAELESEERWAELFALPESEDLLERVADVTLEEHWAGRTKPPTDATFGWELLRPPEALGFPD